MPHIARPLVLDESLEQLRLNAFDLELKAPVAILDKMFNEERDVLMPFPKRREMHAPRSAYRSVGRAGFSDVA